MPTTRDISRMRARMESKLSDSADIYRSTKTSNNQGGSTPAWAKVNGATFDCLLAPLKRQTDDEVIADRNAKFVRRVLTYPTATTLEMTDRIEVQGEMWDVVKLMEPRSINIVNRAELVRIDE